MLNEASKAIKIIPWQCLSPEKNFFSRVIPFFPPFFFFFFDSDFLLAQIAGESLMQKYHCVEEKLFHIWSTKKYFGLNSALAALTYLYVFNVSALI